MGDARKVHKLGCALEIILAGLVVGITLAWGTYYLLNYKQPTTAGQASHIGNHVYVGTLYNEPNFGGNGGGELEKICKIIGANKSYYQVDCSDQIGYIPVPK